MPFLSQLLNRPVINASGATLGKVVDLPAATDTPYPPVRGLIVRPRRGAAREVPWDKVDRLEQRVFRLKVDDLGDAPPADGDGALWLARDVLDKQIVDVEGAKLVRVNDVQLARIDRDLRVAAVDNTARGFLRRLGLEGVTRVVGQGRRRPELIDWEEIDLVPGLTQDVKLKVPYNHLRRQHPAEIAEIIGQLSPSAGAHALESMDDETAAQALAELAPEHATAVLNAMDEEEAADILEEMDADDAADLLGELDEEFAEDLMGRMETEAAKDVRELMGYREDTAGGLMNTEFVALAETMTVDDVIAYLRSSQPDEDSIHYVYVVDNERHLTGSVSLRDIIVSPPEKPIGAIMEHDIVSVPVTADEAEVARLLLKYNLVTIPVVNTDGRLIGIISFDDVMDVVAPRSWQNRPRRMLS